MANQMRFIGELKMLTWPKLRRWTVVHPIPLLLFMACCLPATIQVKQLDQPTAAHAALELLAMFGFGGLLCMIMDFLRFMLVRPDDPALMRRLMTFGMVLIRWMTIIMLFGASLFKWETVGPGLVLLSGYLLATYRRKFLDRSEAVVQAVS